MLEPGTSDEVTAAGCTWLAEVDAFQPALLMPGKAELPVLAYDRVYVTVFVLVDVDVSVTSGPANV